MAMPRDGGRNLREPGSAGAWPPRSLIGELPEDVRDELLRLGARRRFARGEVIMSEDGRSTEVYIILTGFVRVLNHTHTGEETMIAIRTVGDVVGELAALDGRPRTSTAVAASPTLTRVVDGPLFRSFAARVPAFGTAVARSVVAKLRTATRYRVETGQASVLTRVARVLTHLTEAYGRPISSGLLVDVPLPQTDLASLAMASERSVRRAYQRLRDAGAVDLHYRQVVVRDTASLRRFADGIEA
jgi:CRP-like cAMP-binding protein